MNLTKDAYLEIAKAADDRTIVKMLSVNRKFHDDEFFKLIFQYKYPLLLKFKKENETWKDFYLRMVMYIAKLKEEYGLDYIPSSEFNPESFYKQTERDAIDWQLDAADYLHNVQDLEFIRNFLMKYDRYLDFDHLIRRDLWNNRDLERIKLFVDSDVKANSFRKFYSPMYTNSIYDAINNENVELLKILILPNIRQYDLENFIEYAQQQNKPLSEKYFLSLRK